MSCAPRPETAPRRRRPGAAPAAALVVSFAWALCAFPARAEEEKFLVGGLLDAEYWSTDDGSRLLSRNDGDPAHAGNLRLWTAGEFVTGLQGFAMGAVEGGPASEEEETDADLEQAFVRYTFRTRTHLRMEAGKLVAPLGNFTRRYLSNVNPLIGSPDSYSVSYPLGVQVLGRVAAFDYSVSVLDRPLVNENYVPELRSSTPRPAVTLGWTPMVGMRLGGYGTMGPYLSEDVAPLLPAGPAWDDYEQTVYGFDLTYSRGHFELNGDYARSSYDAPGLSQRLRGTAYYVEPKFTFSPRWFAALRYELNDYPYIQPLSPGIWRTNVTKLSDIEAGIGFRINPDAILKVSYRVDQWDVAPSLKAFFPEGHAIAAQLSYTFDVVSWFDRPK